MRQINTINTKNTSGTIMSTLIVYFSFQNEQINSLLFLVGLAISYYIVVLINIHKVRIFSIVVGWVVKHMNMMIFSKNPKSQLTSVFLNSWTRDRPCEEKFIRWTSL